MGLREIYQKLAKISDQGISLDHGICGVVAIDAILASVRQPQLPLDSYLAICREPLSDKEVMQLTRDVGGKDASSDNLPPGQRKKTAVRIALNQGARTIAQEIQRGEKAALLIHQVNGGGHCRALIPGPGCSILEVNTMKGLLIERHNIAQARDMIKRTWRGGVVCTIPTPREKNQE